VVPFSLIRRWAVSGYRQLAREVLNMGRNPIGLRVCGGRRAILAAALLGAGAALLARPAEAGYVQQNLVSDLLGVAPVQDSNLVNPWGMSSGPTTPIWVSDNGSGKTTLYNGLGQPFPVGAPLVITIAPPAGGTTSAPTGQVFNGNSSAFLLSATPGSGARFIFATEDGTISGWNSGLTSSILKVDNSPSGAVYKGLAIGSNASGNFLYAANFHNGSIDVFDTNFTQVTLPGGFVDPTLPAGFAPFNIQNIGGKLYVTYAMQDAAKHDDVAGPGNGFVDVFDTNGNFLQRLVSMGPLNSPWGLALAPSNFGQFSNDLLVGNFGDGVINAFNPTSGLLLGQLDNAGGSPITIDGLWGLHFGTGSANGGAADTLFFTAGIPGTGMVEDHGLFGDLRLLPEPGSLALLATGLIGLTWRGRRRLQGLPG
jgi:uncharacterized protein (TIGR03118 family)